MPNIVICTFATLFIALWKGQEEDIKVKITSNGYKYQWNKLNKHNTNIYIEHLLCFVMIPST